MSHKGVSQRFMTLLKGEISVTINVGFVIFNVLNKIRKGELDTYEEVISMILGLIIIAMLLGTAVGILAY
jgi:hypothetical protein